MNYIDEKIKVSILIPTYNRKYLLRRAIDTSLKQTYSNLEIIIIDNASTDGTDDFIKQYSNHEKVKYYRNKKNLGMSLNWQKALYEHCSGQWAILLSDDDYFINDSYIEKAINLINSNDNLSIVISDYIIDCTYKNNIIEGKYNLEAITEGKEYFKNFFTDRGPNPRSTLWLFNVNYAKEVNAYKQDVYNLDQLLFLNLLLKGNVGYIKEKSLAYKIHESNSSNNVVIDKDILAIEKYEELISRAIKEYGFEYENMQEIKKRMVAAYFKWRFYYYYIQNRKCIYDFYEYIGDNNAEVNNFMNLPSTKMKLFIPIRLLKLIRNIRHTLKL